MNILLFQIVSENKISRILGNDEVTLYFVNVSSIFGQFLCKIYIYIQAYLIKLTYRDSIS